MGLERGGGGSSGIFLVLGEVLEQGSPLFRGIQALAARCLARGRQTIGIITRLGAARSQRDLRARQRLCPKREFRRGCQDLQTGPRGQRGL